MTFVVDAPRRRVWRLLHPKPPVGVPLPRTVEYDGGRMQILVEGDEAVATATVSVFEPPDPDAYLNDSTS